MTYQFDYRVFKKRLLKEMAILNAVVIVAMVLFCPTQVFHYIQGVSLAYGYVLTLFVSAESPLRKYMAAISVLRVFLLGLALFICGQFRPLETGVVFCGFLSYKVVLMVEYLRNSIGIWVKHDN